MDPNNKKTINNITVLNWNADGIKRQRSVFIEFLSRHNVDVACISETHLLSSDKFKLPGYEVYRKDRETSTASGGVAIIIKRKLAHHSLADPNLVNLETVAINMSLDNNTEIALYAAYKQPKKRILEEDLIKIFNTSNTTLLIGDLNCKLKYWGCRADNPNGTRLNSIMTNQNIQISTPDEYTYYPYRPDYKPDILDVILHKNFQKPIYQTVLNELDSDHLPVSISFLHEPQQIPALPRLINGKMDWNKFQSELDKNIKGPGPIYTTNEIDQAVSQYTETIKDSVQPALTLVSLYN